MASPKETLPEFDSPPVIETALGVEFVPLSAWGIPHFGLFWGEIREEFDRFEIQPPLATQIERFGAESWQQPKATVEFLQSPEVRCWFVHRDNEALLQIQNNRFNYNWRKNAGAAGYPRYEKNIRPAFDREWSRFTRFIESQQLGVIDVIQCEVTYVNHLELGVGWRTAADLHDVFPCWSGAFPGGFLPSPERVHFGVNFLMPDDLGRLRVTLQPAVRGSDGVEVLQLTLTARGRPAGTEASAVLNWLDLGRSWVVRGFHDLTSPKMHYLWKKKG